MFMSKVVLSALQPVDFPGFGPCTVAQCVGSKPGDISMLACPSDCRSQPTMRDWEDGASPRLDQPASQDRLALRPEVEGPAAALVSGLVLGERAGPALRV